MIKKTITYTDYNDVVRTEDHYFNLSKAELMDMQMSVDGGMDEVLKKIVAANNMTELYKIFKDLVLKAYGEKSQDGKRFIKSDEIRIAFSQTEAYNQLWVSLATNADEAAEFVNALVGKQSPEIPAAASN